MKFLYLALFVLFSTFATSQNTPVVSKVTASWCPNCGAWGWDFMEDMKAKFQSGPVTLLGVHHSGDLENPTSDWFANNLNFSRQPQFYLNNDLMSTGSTTWEDAVDEIPTSVETINDNATAQVSYNSVLLKDGALTVAANVDLIPSTPNKLLIATYVFENNVENNQAQQGPDAIHPNVLRATMTDDFEGTHITDFGNYDFNMDLDSDWNEEEIGILTIIWEEEADGYKILASTAAHNVALLSSNEIILDANKFTFQDDAATLTITSSDDTQYSLSLTDMAGKLVTEQAFSRETSLDKQDHPLFCLTNQNGF